MAAPIQRAGLRGSIPTTRTKSHTKPNSTASRTLTFTCGGSFWETSLKSLVYRLQTLPPQKRKEGGREGHPLELPAPNPAGYGLVYCCLDCTKYFATVCTNGRASAGVAWLPFKIVSKGISAPYRVRVSSWF